MKNNQSFSIMASAIAVLFCAIGCNAPTKEAEVKKEATKAVEAVVPAPFVPFKVMSATHTVKDFDVWKKSYDEHESMRVANGLTKLAVCRDMDSPNNVYVFLKMADVQKAKDFAANKDLKEAMQKGGVTSAPTFLYVDVIRFEESPTEHKDSVTIVDKIEVADYGKFIHIMDIEGNKIELWQPNDVEFEKLGIQIGAKTTK